MGALFSYSLGASVFLLFGYLAYKLFLAAEKQLTLNRVVLIFIYVISLAGVPLLAMEWGSREMPVAGAIELGAVTVSVIPSEDAGSPMVVPKVLLLTYLAGVSLTAIFTLTGVVRLMFLLRKGRRIRRDGYTLIILPACEVPFSFGRYIVVGEGETSADQQIEEAHEEAHLRCRHWLDLLLAQGVCILLWYNPVAWLMRDELRQVHEYQADAAVLSKGYDPYQYQMLLIKKAAGRRLQSLANSLNHSNLSKRITMMYKTENRALRSMRALALLPAVALAALAVNQPAVATTIEQAGSASLISTPDVAETFGDSKVSENLSEVQLFETTEEMPELIEEAPEAVSETPEAVAEVYEAVSEAPAPQLKGRLVAVEDKVYNSVAQMPQFPGGDAELMKYISYNIKYPAEAMAANEQGMVIVRFVIDKDGSVRDASIVRGRAESLNKEALRVVSTLPAFIPGKNEKGEAVACNYTLPISFKLQSDEKKPKEVVKYTGNLKINNYDNKAAYFVNGELYEGDPRDIVASNIQSITIEKNDPAYPQGKVMIVLKE